MNNLQVNPFESPDTLIDLSLSIKFDEHFLLSRLSRRIWEELEYEWIITSQSVVRLPERLPKNRSFGFLKYNSPKAAIIFEVFFGTFGAGHLLCEPVGKIKVGW